MLTKDIDSNNSADANGMVADWANVNGDNSYHVLFLDGATTPITNTTISAGFAITAGQAIGLSDQNRFGGGLY